MKRLKIFSFMLLPLMLSSCGSNRFIGTYSFQLGRDSGTHFGVFATTTKTTYTYTDDEGQIVPLAGSYLMKLRLKLGGASLGGFFDSLNINDVTLRTYYSVGKSLGGDKGNVLKFGFNIKEVIENIFPSESDDDEPSELVSTNRDNDTPEEGEDDPVSPIPDDYFDITPEQTAKFVYSTISETTLVFNIPVSIEDLQYQLYWYGLDLTNLDAELVEHEVGSHPSEEEIKYINEDLDYPSSHDGKNFRDYHTLSLALTKK